MFSGINSDAISNQGLKHLDFIKCKSDVVNTI